MIHFHVASFQCYCNVVSYGIGVGAGPAGPVLAGPLFIQGKNKISFLQKPSKEQKC